MASALYAFLVETAMKESSRITRKKGGGFLLGKVKVSMKESGKTATNMVEESCIGLTEKEIKGIGKIT